MTEVLENAAAYASGADQILVVEDDPRMRQLMQWALEDAGYTVDAVADGEQALGAAARHAPKLVVLDVTLPTLGGAEVAYRLRASFGDGLPVLVVTADGQAAEKARLARAFGYLRKPFDPDHLVRAVRDGLGGRSFRPE